MLRFTRKPKPPRPQTTKASAIRRHYEPRIRPGRANHDVVNWASVASQKARFHVLVQHVDLRRSSLLDVGCGLGDLWGYLKGRGLEVDYTGVDIVPKMVEAALQCHPDGRFMCADVFADSPFGEGAFDAVFCSGTFNLNLGNNREFLPVAFGRLFGLARRHVVFNLLHNRWRSRDSLYYHADPKDVRRTLKRFDCQVRILEDYLPNDFTVICRKADPGGSDSR